MGEMNRLKDVIRNGLSFMAALTTGGSDLDAFIDDVSIKTVPEPSVISLLVVGLGGLALNRLKSMRESR